jgi:hypothetical protein
MSGGGDIPPSSQTFADSGIPHPEKSSPIRQKAARDPPSPGLLPLLPIFCKSANLQICGSRPGASIRRDGAAASNAGADPRMRLPGIAVVQNSSSKARPNKPRALGVDLKSL